MILEVTAENIWYSMIQTTINLGLQGNGIAVDIYHLKKYLITYCRLHLWELGSVNEDEDKMDQANLNAMHEIDGIGLKVELFKTYCRMGL